MIAIQRREKCLCAVDLVCSLRALFVSIGLLQSHASSTFSIEFLALSGAAALDNTEPKAKMMMTNRNNIGRLFIFCCVTVFACSSQPAKRKTAMDPIYNNTAYKLSKVFSVTPDKLHNAFLSETTLQKIWGVSSISIDARPEGKARAKLQIENENWDFTITYKEIVQNEKLRWIVHFDRFPSKETRVTLWFRNTTGGTELTVRQENFENAQERDSNRAAWEGALKTLEGLVSQ